MLLLIAASMLPFLGQDLSFAVLFDLVFKALIVRSGAGLLLLLFGDSCGIPCIFGDFAPSEEGWPQVKISSAPHFSTEDIRTGEHISQGEVPNVAFTRRGKQILYLMSILNKTI